MACGSGIRGGGGGGGAVPWWVFVGFACAVCLTACPVCLTAREKCEIAAVAFFLFRGEMESAGRVCLVSHFTLKIFEF